MAIIANQDIQSKGELGKGRQHFLDKEDIFSILQIYFKVFQEGLPGLFPRRREKSGSYIVYIALMFYNVLLSATKRSQY